MLDVTTSKDLWIKTLRVMGLVQPTWPSSTLNGVSPIAGRRNDMQRYLRMSAFFLVAAFLAVGTNGLF
jgi:hypothetical protein